jgi:hypothetical protein
MVVAIIMYFWMPDSPTEAKFLSDDDKVLAIERLRSNHMGVMSREWRYPQFFEAFWDVKTWLWIALIFAISVPSNGISTFGPLIIQSFVSDPYQTMLFNVPVGISHIIAVSGSAYLSMKLKLKGPIIVLLCIPPLIGFSILLSYEHNLENRGILLAGYFCLSTFTGISKSPSFIPRCVLDTDLRSSSHILLVLSKHGWRHQEKILLSTHPYRVIGRQHDWALAFHA